MTEELLEQKKRLFEVVANLRSANIKNLCDDYSLWDEMVDFTKTCDETWGEEIISTSLPTYKVDYTWTYNIKDSLIHESCSSDTIVTPTLHFNKATISTFFAGNRSMHFFYMHKNMLIEIYGASIHPTTDRKREVVPAGYFFVGKNWDLAYLKELRTIVECKEIKIPKNYNESVIVPTRNDSIIYFAKEMNTPLNKTKSLSVIVSVDTQKLLEYNNHTKRNILILSLFYIFFGLISILLLTRWIVSPIRRISIALKNEDQRIIEKLKLKKHEFGEIAQMISGFFVQKAELFDEEQRMRQLTENIEDVFIVRDLQNSILYLSPAFEKIFKHRITDLKKNALEFREWIYDTDKLRLKAKLYDDIYMNSAIFNEQFRVVISSYSNRWLWWRDYPIYDSEGKIYRIASIISDISKQKEIEDELLNAKIKAEESDRLKSVFLENISHEVRTPMNGIIGFAELLIAENIAIEDAKKYASIIVSNTNQLLQTFSNMIDISRIQLNQLQLKRESCFMNELLVEFYTETKVDRERLGKENIEIYYSKGLKNVDSFIYTDRHKFKQVLNNLLNNALKFTNHGFVKFGYQQLDSNTLEFFVEDTGIGVPNDKLNLIFESFIQIDDSPTRKYSGTGLGLTIVKGFVEALRGKVTIQSREGFGTTIRFTIPYHKVDAVDMASYSSQKINSQAKWAGRTILIVEDDMLSYQYIATILQPKRVKIVHARDGMQAVEICMENKYIDLVIMDLHLPKMSGYEATMQIKRFRKDLPVIAQTGNDMPENLQKSRDAGCDDYIEKPIKAKTMIEKIERFLK